MRLNEPGVIATLHRLPREAGGGRTRDTSAWALHFTLPQQERPSAEQVAEMWREKPSVQSEIVMMGKRVRVPRFDRSYGHAYTFSGVKHQASPVPECFAPFLAYANRVCSEMLARDYAGRQFNMVFVNWYDDGHHYIGWHSDDETQLYRNARQETLVFSVSFGETRRFLLRRKQSKEEKPRTLELSHCACVIMGGTCQRDYKHSVPKETGRQLGRRLNLTCRIFK